MGLAANAADPAAIDQAFEQLRTFEYGQALDPVVLIEAAVEDASNDPAARADLVRRLAEVLGHSASPVAARQFACRMFERIGGDDQVPALAALLNDADLADSARCALERIPGDAAAQALRNALATAQGALLVGIINALGERHDAAALDAMAARFGDGDAAVAVAAVRAAGKIGTAEAVAALTQAQSTGAPEVAEAAQAALLNCAGQFAADGNVEAAKAIYTPMLDGELPHVRMAALSGLAALEGREALPMLLDAFSSDEDADVRGSVAVLLGRIPEAAEAIIERLPNLDAAGRIAAIGILADTGSPVAKEVVTGMVEDGNEAVRVAALRALATLGDAQTVEVLAGVAAQGEGDVQQAARAALARLAGADVDVTILKLAAESAWAIRVECLNAAVKRAVPEAMPVLMAAAQDDHHLVRLAGFDGVQATAGAEQYQELVHLLVNAPTTADVEAARKAVLASAKQVEAPDCRTKPVLEVFGGARPEVKIALIQALGTYGDAEALAAVADAIKDPAAEVQDAAVRALADWPGEDAVPLLLALITDPANAAHRTLALRGHLNHVREKASQAPDAAVEGLQQVRDQLTAADAKQMALAILGDAGTIGALEMAASFIGDADVAEEARLTTFALVDKLDAAHHEAVKAILPAVAEQTADAEAARQAKILASGDDLVSIFDGESMNGWMKPFDWGEVHIEDSAIHLKSDRKFFLVTEKTYGDFVLELEAYLDEGANSGIQYRSHYEQNSLWGYQADLDSLPRQWRGIYDEATGRDWLDRGEATKAEALYQPTWNRYRVECDGDRTRFFMNGELIVDYLDPMEIEGHIALQHHGEEGKVVRFRNIRILDLGTRGWRPLIDEKTLPNWVSNGSGTWSVEDGVITGQKAEGGYGLLYSPETYRDFCIRFSAKAIEGNAGFYLRAEKLPGSEGARGLQVEIDPAKDQAGLFETSGRDWVAKPNQDVVKEHFKPGDWNEMAVCAHGGRLSVFLNGYRTVELTDDPGRADGYFGLGLHSNPTNVQFKDIVILSH